MLGFKHRKSTSPSFSTSINPILIFQHTNNGTMVTNHISYVSTESKATEINFSRCMTTSKNDSKWRQESSLLVHNDKQGGIESFLLTHNDQPSSKCIQWDGIPQSPIPCNTIYIIATMEAATSTYGPCLIGIQSYSKGCDPDNPTAMNTTINGSTLTAP